MMFFLFACKQNAEIANTHDDANLEKHTPTFDRSNYKHKLGDTIYVPEDYQNSCIMLSSSDYKNIFKKEKNLENQYDEAYYFHSLIKDTDEEKIITLVAWHDGGYESIMYLIIKPDTTQEFILAEKGEEESSYSVLKGNTLTNFFKYKPMTTEWFDREISNIGFYWDEYELTTSKYLLEDGHPKFVGKSSKIFLSNLNLYTTDEFQKIYSQQIDAANALLSYEKLENYEQFKKLALDKALEIQKTR